MAEEAGPKSVDIFFASSAMYRILQVRLLLVLVPP